MKLLKNIGLFILGIIVFFTIQKLFFLETNRAAAMSSQTANVYLILGPLLSILILIPKNKIKGFAIFLFSAFLFSFLFPKIFNGNSSVTNKDCDEINGTYHYEDESADLYIIIAGENWISEFKPKTNVSSYWDQLNTDYSVGLVKNKELFDKTGLLNLGYIDCGYINTTFYNHQLRFKKE